MKAVLRFLLILLMSLLGAGAYAGESKIEQQYVSITVEAQLGIDDLPEPPANYLNHRRDKLTWHLVTPSDTWCKSAVKTIFRDSSHPGSNPYQRFNEHNGGIAMLCSESENSPFYTIIGGVHNSRDSDAVFWGKGIRFRTPELVGFSAGVGLELSLVYYGFDDRKGYQRVMDNAPADLIAKLGRIPVGRSGYMLFPLPTLVYQVGYSWGNEYTRGRISFVERNLAGAAQLRGIELVFVLRFR